MSSFTLGAVTAYEQAESAGNAGTSPQAHICLGRLTLTLPDLAAVEEALRAAIASEYRMTCAWVRGSHAMPSQPSSTASRSRDRRTSPGWASFHQFVRAAGEDSPRVKRASSPKDRSTSRWV